MLTSRHVDAALKFDKILYVCLLIQYRRTDASINDLCELSINVIVYSAIVYFGVNVREINIQSTQRHICCFDKRKVMSTYSFVQWIFNCSHVDHAGHKGLHWIKDCIKYLIAESNNAWQDTLPKVFDQYLRDLNTHFIFPFPRQQMVVIVTYINWVGRGLRLIKNLCLLRFKYGEICLDSQKTLLFVLKETDQAWLEKCDWDKLVHQLLVISTLGSDKKSAKKMLREIIVKTSTVAVH